MNVKIEGKIKSVSEIKKGFSKKDNKPWSSMSYYCRNNGGIQQSVQYRRFSDG